MRFLVGLLVAAGCGAELTEDQKQNLLPDASAGRDAAIDVPPVDARPCTGGLAAMQQPGGACYVLFPGPKVRSEAEADCVALGGHLAAIKTAATNALVATLVANSPAAFLGGTDLAAEGTFVWPDGSPAIYTNWRTGEPNNGNGSYEEDCIVIQGLLAGVWDDRPCAPPPVGSGSYAYVCSY